MATCLTSINTATDQMVELSSDVVYTSTINQTFNAVYILSNELDQSVFFNIRVLGATSNISFTLTVYNDTTLAQFGNLTINQSSVNTSFNIKAGRYYVCIRSQVLPYNVELTPKFISYNKVATLQPRCYMGSTSICEDIKTSRPAGLCTRRLVFTLVEGALPTGLTMLENGFITGFLPILDTDEYNKDLPPSNTWYHKVNDDEYVTNWGRAYRFKVHLTLYDDRTTEDVRWFYISIINDYSKNLALIEKYEELEDSRDVTFEERIRLDESLCPPCGSTIDPITNRPILNVGPNFNGNNITNPNLSNNSEDNSVIINEDDSIISMDKDNIIKLINGKNENNELYNLVENNIIEDEENIILYDNDFNNILDEDGDKDVELIIIPESNDISFDIDGPLFYNINLSDIDKKNLTTFEDKENLGLVEYYINNFERDDDFIAQLKDSSMFQCYLRENNIDPTYILEYPIERNEYEDLKITYIIIEDEITKGSTNFIQLENNASKEPKIIEDVEIDAADAFTSQYEDNYAKLPLMVFNIWGWESEVRLVVSGK